MNTPKSIWSPRCDTSNALEVHLLGLVDFGSAVALQERLVYEIAGRNDRQGALLLCEHPPIVTVGREGSRSQISADPRELVSRQVPVRWMNRGGGCFIHAPGQLAVYPILPLDRLRLGLSEYRNVLESAAINACRAMRVAASSRQDRPGIWSRHGQLGYLGVAVRHWVTYHGLYLNVAPAMDLLRLVDPNGTHERPATLAMERQRPVAMHTVRVGMIQHIVSALGYQQHHIYTGHPLLKRVKKTYAYA